MEKETVGVKLLVLRKKKRGARKEPILDEFFHTSEITSSIDSGLAPYFGELN